MPFTYFFFSYIQQREIGFKRYRVTWIALMMPFYDLCFYFFFLQFITTSHQTTHKFHTRTHFTGSILSGHWNLFWPHFLLLLPTQEFILWKFLYFFLLSFLSFFSPPHIVTVAMYSHNFNCSMVLGILLRIAFHFILFIHIPFILELISSAISTENCWNILLGFVDMLFLAI